MGLNDNLCGKSNLYSESKDIWERCFFAIKQQQQKTILDFHLWGECGGDNHLSQYPQHAVTLHWDREKH